MRVAVAVIDTGVSPEVLPPGVLLTGVNLSGEGEPDDTTDRHGHGTAVARVVLHAAPMASIVPVKLLGEYGYPRVADHLEVAFEWVAAHQAESRIRVVCGAFADTSHLTGDAAFRGTRLQMTVAALRAAGVATVAPAGNGYQSSRHWSEQGMAWPAILREVVSVGAVQADAELGLRLARTSQRLSTAGEAGCRTTLFAEPDELKDTSGAAAVVAGRLTALAAGSPEAGVDALVDALLSECQQVPDEHGATWTVLVA